MSSISRIRNIGIAAHIDAGKTTVTERILFFTGVTRRLGEVHDGQATMDFMKQEQERGITIASAAISCRWKDNRVNIIDTPGHVDFTLEVERSLRVIDGMVAVFCSVAGVEPQSETVWNQAERYRVPRLAFINKLDREGADFDNALATLDQQLDANPVALQLPIGLGADHQGVINLIEMNAELLNPDGHTEPQCAIPPEYADAAAAARQKLVERLAEFDDVLMQNFLDDQTIAPEDLWRAARAGVLRMLYTPVVCGAAYKNSGVHSLLDAVVALLPSPMDIGAVVGSDLDDEEKVHSRRPLASDPFAALAFKIIHDPYVGQQTFARIYSGTLSPGEAVFNTSKDIKERVSRVLEIRAKERHDLTSAGPGDIVALVGLKRTTTGDTLCPVDKEHRLLLERIHIPETVISMAVSVESSQAEEKLAKALAKLSTEDPSFTVRTDDETKETLIGGMGELHLEVIVSRLASDFAVVVQTSPPKVSYRETISELAQVDHRLVKQTGGKGQFAHVVLVIEPCAEKNFDFESVVVGGRVPREYWKSVRMGCEDAMKKGALAGYPVINVKTVLKDGSYHEVDSSEMAFRNCAGQAFQKAFLQAKPQLLEPLMKLELASPDEYLGDVIGDLNRRRGKIGGMRRYRKGSQKVTAEVPLGEMFGYATTLRSLSSGRANYAMEFSHYAPVPAAMVEKIVAEARARKR